MFQIGFGPFENGLAGLILVHRTYGRLGIGARSQVRLFCRICRVEACWRVVVSVKRGPQVRRRNCGGGECPARIGRPGRCLQLRRDWPHMQSHICDAWFANAEGRQR